MPRKYVITEEDRKRKVWVEPVAMRDLFINEDNLDLGSLVDQYGRDAYIHIYRYYDDVEIEIRVDQERVESDADYNKRIERMEKLVAKNVANRAIYEAQDKAKLTASRNRLLEQQTALQKQLESVQNKLSKI